jgi:hypothetical protein
MAEKVVKTFDEMREYDRGTDMTTFFGASIGPAHSTES